MDIEIQDTENTNEWINWIEEAIAKEYLKYYEYKNFSNIKEIGFGGFGKVFRAKWKKNANYFALKSFFNLNNVTVKEIVREVIYLKLSLTIQYLQYLINNTSFRSLIPHLIFSLNF